jgi:methyltransferase (TIGR00027 family)
MQFIQTFVYIVLQLVLLPLSILGYLQATMTTIRYAKSSGTSMTATSILGGRMIMHRFGVREDAATVALLKQLPFISSIAYNLVLAPAIIAHKLTGYVPTMAKLIPPNRASLPYLVNCRTGIIDRLFTQAKDEIEQVVVMGAGYDTRVMKFRDQLHAQCYELDQPATQNLKLKAYSDAGLDVEWIHFVPVDFNQESWSDKLVERGFDSAKKTFWLWEGVTLYLDESIVVNTLKEIHRLSASRSRVVFDFYSQAFVNLEGPVLMRTAAKKLLKTSGEPFKFGIDTTSNPKTHITSLLKETSFSIEELSLLGRDPNSAFAGIVEIVKD